MAQVEVGGGKGRASSSPVKTGTSFSVTRGGEPLHRLGVGPDRLGGFAIGGQAQRE